MCITILLTSSQLKIIISYISDFRLDFLPILLMSVDYATMKIALIDLLYRVFHRKFEDRNYYHPVRFKILDSLNPTVNKF